MEGGSTSISKVTVEYHDPSGVFPLISRQLQSRLPLRDLHWKSPTRPLRSIDFLHVDLTPSRDAAPGTPQSRQGTPIPSLEDGAAGSNPTENGQQGFFKERRHQIPGLRQTPYVKVYLLRCDDSETYKASSRKALREWWKTHTPASQSSSSKNPQENHDAYERLILHVVLPNTAAAGQARSTGSSSRSEGGTSERAGASSRLLNRSTTILEKIKADFNASSKSAPDRVAQIRLVADDIPQSLLPTKSPDLSADYTEGPQERSNAWIDVVLKLKSLILSSFNLRVSQYEEDIRERDAQRSLPGWNFCTFFVLKEGLARGFESVGLVDDALIGYDELSIGLENAIQEQEGDGSSTRSDFFVSYTKELKDILVQSQVETSPEKASWDSNSKLLSATRKGYREKILGSNISIFDFKCYIFARQMALLLRMGILHSSELASLRQERKLSQSDTDDLGSLSELCRRAAAFVASVSRIMREDLRHAAHAHDIEPRSGVIDNIVASWAFGVAEQILDETNVASLPKLGLGPQANTSATSPKAAANPYHPARSSSLSHRANTGNSSTKTEDADLAIFDKLGQKALLDSQSEPAPPSKITDVESLSGHRAELYILQRQIMERTAKHNGWSLGLSRLRALLRKEQTGLEDVDLTGNADSAEESESPSGDITDGTLTGVCQETLMNAVVSLDEFKASFEVLTNLALTHLLTAARLNSIERLIADLALVKFDAGDFVAATNYLTRITASYADRQWGLIETSLLKIHAQCLKKLNRRDDYARMLLSMLAKTVAQQKSHLQLKLRNRLTSQDPWQDDDHVETSGLLAELITYSEELPYDLPVPMARYFTDITVDPYIRHFDDRDGFSVKLKLRHLLDEDLKIENTKVRLSSIVAGSNREIWLENADCVVLTTGVNSIQIGANITTMNSFSVDKIVMKTKKISFEYEALPKPDVEGPFRPTTPHDLAAGLSRSRLVCYPRPESFHTELSLSRSLHIDKIRTLEIRCSSGWNDISRAEIQLRSASAGLRLRTADASLDDTTAKLAKPKATGVIELSEISPNTGITIHVPYNVEEDLHEISLRLDITYFTPLGRFEHFSNPTISTELSVDVNVHDLFKSSLLFSRFLIRPSRGVPLHIHSVHLEGTDRYSVTPPPCVLTPLLVFPSQPATMMYQVTPNTAIGGQSRPRRQSIAEESPLILTIDYGCIDEYAIEGAKSVFEEAVLSSQFAPLRLLLVQTFTAQLRRAIPTAQYIEATLVHQLHLPNFPLMRWDVILDSLPSALTKDLRSWLQQWHLEHEIISIPQLLHADTQHASSNAHRITMNVPLPRLHILQTASLTFPKSNPAVFSTGCLIPAEVTIKHTRQWDSPAAFKSVCATLDAPLEFVFDIEAPSDTWLIGGQRRTRFLAEEDETKSWTVMLIPQRAGRLLLPTVDIRIIGKGADDITCETDLRSLGDTAIVIADLGSTTIGLSEGSLGAEAVLIGSDKRRPIIEAGN